MPPSAPPGSALPGSNPARPGSLPASPALRRAQAGPARLRRAQAGPARLRRALLATASAVVLAAIATVATAGPAGARTTPPVRTTGPATTPNSATAGSTTLVSTTIRWIDITARDGVVLKANVVEPTTAGPHPAVVFVNSWGLNDLEYLAQATALGSRGYVVLSYTTRGFWGSGGRIETAGPADIADVSAAVDWMLANTGADPAHIGAAGISYGAGISLIASAFDPRIRAVVAMSAWTDLVSSLYGGNTRRPQAVWLLRAAAELFGTPSDELRTMTDDYFANRNIDQVKAWARVRSAGSYIDAVNLNHPAVLIANAYGDSLFPPNHLVDFFGRLTGPKRLELAPGDHAVVEGFGLAGLPNHVWTSANRWFDQYLAGVDTGIGGEPPVVLRRLGTDAVESYPDWAHVARSTTRFGLGAVRWWDGTGPLGGTPTTGWSRTVWAGTDTTADAGVALLTNGFVALTGIPPTVWLPSVNRLNAGVWVSSSLASTTAVRGVVRLHLALASPPATGTFVAYLYDLDGLDYGTLITHAPATWLTSTGGLDVTFPATAYDVPAGHRLALAVDTVDPLYLDANSWGTPIDVTGASWLDVPVK